MEDHERRPHVVPRIRRDHRGLVHRRARGRTLECECGVRRNGRLDHRRLDQRRQWCVEDDRRREDVEAHGPRRDEADSVDRRRPAQCGRRARCGAGRHPREERRPRRLSQHGRRLHVDEDARGRRHEWRAEGGHCVRPPGRRLRDDGATLHLATAAERCECAGRRLWRRRAERSDRSHGTRPLQVRRRRHYMEGARRRWSAAHCRANVDRGGDEHQCAARLSHHQRRSVSLRRRRCVVEADGRGRRAHSQWAGWLQLRRVRRPEESGRRVHLRDVGVQVGRRRQHVHRLSRSARRRRSTTGMDRSDERQPHAVRLRPGRDRHLRRRRELEHVVQPVHRTGLPHLRRQLVSVLGLRHAAGRGRGPRPAAWQRRRDHALRLGLGERLGVGHDRRRPARSEHRVLERKRHREDQLSVRAVDLGEPAGEHGNASKDDLVAAAGLGAVEPARAARRLSVRDGDDRRRRALEEDQP